MMKKEIEHTAVLLDELTHILKTLELWQTQWPNKTDLASSAPFCCDTLLFEQWLQFVFIPKIREMITLGQALPTKIALTPIADESFKYLSSNAKPLLEVIKRIDQVLTV